MLSNKIRTITISLVALASFALAALMPAASQAQWHHYCVRGKCVEHANYNYANPCSGGKKSAAVLTPEAQKQLEEERKKKEQEEKEGKIHTEEVEKFFYGCESAPPPTSGTGTVKPPKGVVVGRLKPRRPRKASAPATTSSLAIPIL
jgi:hypothetical protein